MSLIRYKIKAIMYNILSYFTLPVRSHTSTDIRILTRILCNASIYFYQEDMNSVSYDKVFYIITFL